MVGTVIRETGIVIRQSVFGVLLTLALLLAGPARAADEHGAALPDADAMEYYDLMPMNIPVMTDQGLVQQVSVAVSLQCKPGKREQIAAYKPKLMDAYLRELYGVLGTGQAMIRNDIVDVEAVKSRLSDVTQRVVGPDLVSEVLLQSVHQYKPRR